MTRVNHYITEPQAKALHDLSKRSGLKVAELIRRAIGYYLDASPREDGFVGGRIGQSESVVSQGENHV